MSALRDLISSKVGGEPWAWFFVSSENETFPDGTQDTSGDLVTASGRHVSFWTDWDKEHNCLTFDIWQEYSPTDPDQAGDWTSEREYLNARKKVGL